MTTALLVLASFAAGYLLHWAASRHQVSQARRDALALDHAPRGEPDFAEIIRRAGGW